MGEVGGRGLHDMVALMLLSRHAFDIVQAPETVLESASSTVNLRNRVCVT